MTATDPERHRVLEITTGPETLEDIHGLLDDLWSAHDIPELVRMHTDLAAGEIGANIIEHAGGGSPVRLRMEVQVLPDAIHITSPMTAVPARVDLIADGHARRDVGARPRAGHRARVLDELSYRRDSHGNHWTLFRRLEP